MTFFVVILVFFILGVACQRLFDVPEHVPMALNRCVINVFFPAAVLLNVPAIALSTEAILPALSFWLILLAAALITLTLGKIFNWSADIKCAAFILTTLGNTAFLGFPMVQAFFPQPSLAYALIYDQLGSFIGLSTVATIVVGANSGRRGKLSTLQIAKSIMLFPPFLALLAGLTLPIESLVTVISTPLSWLSGLIIPVTMVAIGLKFTLRIERQYFTPIACILSLKMLIFPLLLWLGLLSLGADTAIAAVSVFQSAMPPMVTGAALLLTAGIANKLVVSTLGLGTLLSFVTLPLLAQLLNYGL